LNKGKFRICSIETTPDVQERTIKPVTKLWEANEYYVTIGDESARDQIGRRLPPPVKKFLLRPEKKATEMAIRAVSYGINRCGEHRLYPGIKSCGGETRIRALS
jgi:hypothetical protein